MICVVSRDVANYAYEQGELDKYDAALESEIEELIEEELPELTALYDKLPVEIVSKIEDVLSDYLWERADHRLQEKIESWNEP